MTNRLDAIESAVVDLVAKVAPWVAPLPTAYLVGRATVTHLAWPVAVGVVAAVIVESLGLATTATALHFREWNRSKRKSDPPAPCALAALLVGVYFVVAVGLTVALDIHPALAVYSPAIFPVLSLAGVTVLALRSDHRRRVEAVDADKAEKRARRAERKSRKSAEVSPQVPPVVSPTAAEDTPKVTPATRARLQIVAEVYGLDMGATLADVAERLGVGVSRASELRSLAVNSGYLTKVSAREFHPNGRTFSEVSGV